MTTQTPLVSLIVRTKDRPKFLTQALTSIAKQTYTHIEVILVNDGGCDLDIAHLEKLLAPVSLFYINNETSQGRSATANIALDNIGGDYVGFLDDDDALLSEHVSTLMTFLNKSDYRIAYSNVAEYHKKFNVKTASYQSKLLNTYAKDFQATELLFYNYIPFNALLFHKEVFASERLDTALELYEDWDLLIRLSQKYPFYHIDKVTAHYNKWSDDLQINNVSHIESMRVNQELIIKRYLSHIPADFLRQLWSEHLAFPETVKALKQDSEQLQKIIDERQLLINDLENNVAKIIQEKDEYLQTQMAKVTAHQEKLIADHDKEIKKHHSQHQREITKLNKQNKKERDKNYALIEEYLHINGECKRAMAQISTTAKKEQQVTAYQAKQINELSEKIQQLNQQLADKNDNIQQKTTDIQQLHTDLSRQQQDLSSLQDELHQIHRSLAWRVVNRLRRILIKSLPAGSLRKKAYISIRHAIGQLMRLFS